MPVMPECRNAPSECGQGDSDPVFRAADMANEHNGSHQWDAVVRIWTG